MKNYFRKVVSFLFIFLLVSFLVAEVISDNTETFIEKLPADFVSRGEDVVYDQWIDKYDELSFDRQLLIDNYSKQYSKELLKKVKQAKSPDEIKSWRNDFSKEEYLLNAKIITGKKINNNISYTNEDIKSGGISLSRIKSLIQRGSPEAFFIDSGKIFVALGTGKNENLSPDDIAVLIRGIFQSKDYSIWLTIDPPAQSAYQKVYGEVKYGGLIQNTHIGSVLFEADRLMKCLSVGYDNRTGKALELGEWNKSEFDFLPQIAVDKSSAMSPQWHRFWFTTEDAVVEIDNTNRTVRLKGPALLVKTERMRMVNGKLQSSFIPVKNTSPQMWTDHFNKNLDKYGGEYPVLKKLDAIARWAVLFMALRETGFVFADFEMPELNYIKTSLRTPVVTVIRERRIEDKTSSGKMMKTGQAIITGGVGFQKMQLNTANLETQKKAWIDKYNNGDLSVERIF